MDAEQSVAEWPDFLVELLAEDIEIANEVNSQSWALYSYSSRENTWPVFGVSHNTVLSYDLEGGITIALDRDSLDESTINRIQSISTPRELKQEWILTTKLTSDFVEHNLHDLRRAHQSVVRKLAEWNAHRWRDHQASILSEFENKTGIKLPSPGYVDELETLRTTESVKRAPSPKSYRSRIAQPTGFWKQTYDLRRPYEKEAYEQAMAEDKLIHRLGHFSSDATTLPADRAAFTREIKELDGISDGFAHRLWMFIFGAQPGDWVIVEAPVPAVGQITGPAYFDEDSHHRAVTWHWVSDSEVESRQIRKAYNRRLWGFTTLEPIEFKRILQALGQHSLVDLSHVSEPDEQPQLGVNVSLLQISPQDISDHFTASGLHYSDTQIADFYTALQTKGFVVLSGISGTGKSKIATGFTELLPSLNRASPSDNSSTQDETAPDNTLIFTTTINASAKKGGTAILTTDAHQLAFLAPGESLPVPVQLGNVVGTITFARRGPENSHPGYPSMEYSKEVQEFIAGWPNGTPYRVFLHRGEPNTAAFERLDVESSIDTKHDNRKNTLFLSVRPDWRDSTSLLGYYNPLTKTYEWTDFLRFILDAAENYRSDDPIAWFVILDEMNLAHVEYYFADLLSVLESGRVSDPEHEDYGFTNQPLRLTYPEIVANEAPPTEVRLPPNLYIIGTVNMDETTHAFSPKVLDRAFTMELTDVDFSDYPRAVPEVDDDTFDDSEKQQFLEVFSQNGAFPQIRKDEIREFVLENEDIRRSIQTLNSNLANYRFHFGYRVFDEIMQFLANAEANGMYENDDHMTALDSAAFMKILPKFSGSEARVGLPLAALIEWAKDPFAQGEDATPLERTLKRAEFMQTVLQTDGFVTAF